jgi:hypothetical protein
MDPRSGVRGAHPALETAKPGRSVQCIATVVTCTPGLDPLGGEYPGSRSLSVQFTPGKT